MNNNNTIPRHYSVSSLSSSLTTQRSPAPIDEGFSEGVRSESASPALELTTLERNAELSARQWLLAQSAESRAAIARELLLSLPNNVVSDIMHEANGRLHFDPVLCLPPEIITDVLGYLDPSTLLSAATVSKSWRDQALEPPLWRQLFGLEGWTSEREKVRSFEDNSRSQIQKIWSNPKIRSRPSDFGYDRHGAKRVRLSQSSNQPEKRIRLWVEHGSLEVPTEWTEESQLGKSDSDQSKNILSSDDFADDKSAHDTVEMPFDLHDGPVHKNDPEQTVCPLLTPSNLIDTMSETPRMNWHWLFKQRQRLEQNWIAGRFTNFRLPHLDYKEEGHTQCVYTLQFSSKHVVSGSRDKTVRVWNLETQRLKFAPLVGHSGSVLCLQFDERSDRDLIISGSSDADVMIWQFSTGKLIKRLRRAHAESVLNLRFDDRYLVTCSKDKTIKLWNMKEMRPLDAEYPQQNRARNAHYPDYIINLAQMREDPKLALVEPLLPYSLIMTFEGHNAAVNAIQIFENHIVSASGDRKIILWDIQTGALVRVFGGHLKGIACVQYDGRRIVSGSSDNTVRIFDSATGAEVAKMEGHSHLVRTVQAEFGDMYDDVDALESEARQNDRQIIHDKTHLRSPTQPLETSQRHYVFGAKLPPGGGGNKWSKIVSGSYDQSVIIWRRDKEGTWKVAKQLRQEDALRATAGDGREFLNGDAQAILTRPPEYNMQAAETHAPPSVPNQDLLRINDAAADNRAFLQHQQILRALQQQQQQSAIQQHTPSTSAALSVIQPAISAVNANANITSPWHSQNQPILQPYDTRISHPRQMHNRVTTLQPQQQHQMHIPAHFNPQNPYFTYQPPPNFAPVMHQNQQHLPNLPPEAPRPPITSMTTPQALLARHTAAFREAANEALERDASRVFKLQFDARRIVSSSQLPVIVGWDFANGDRDIEEASQFFGEPV